MTKHVTHWIGGKPWDGEAGRHGDIYDPATGQVSGQVDFAALAEVDAADRRAGVRTQRLDRKRKCRLIHAPLRFAC